MHKNWSIAPCLMVRGWKNDIFHFRRILKFRMGEFSASDTKLWFGCQYNSRLDYRTMEWLSNNEHRLLIFEVYIQSRWARWVNWAVYYNAVSLWIGCTLNVLSHMEEWSVVNPIDRCFSKNLGQVYCTRYVSAACWAAEATRLAGIMKMYSWDWSHLHGL